MKAGALSTLMWPAWSCSDVIYCNLKLVLRFWQMFLWLRHMQVLLVLCYRWFYGVVLWEIVTLGQFKHSSRCLLHLGNCNINIRYTSSPVVVERPRDACFSLSVPYRQKIVPDCSFWVNAKVCTQNAVAFFQLLLEDFIANVGTSSLH